MLCAWQHRILKIGWIWCVPIISQDTSFLQAVPASGKLAVTLIYQANGDFLDSTYSEYPGYPVFNSAQTSHAVSALYLNFESGSVKSQAWRGKSDL
jgi:hypothetical protein